MVVLCRALASPQRRKCSPDIHQIFTDISRSMQSHLSTGGFVPTEGTDLVWRSSAPTTRLPWARPAGLKASQKAPARWQHQQANEGRWYYTSAEEYEAKATPARAVSDHIGLIMETTLGEQRLGDERCDGCREGDLECWVYSPLAQREVKSASTTCARCRFVPRKGGCSFSTRKKSVAVETPPPGPRTLAPALTSSPGHGFFYS